MGVTLSADERGLLHDCLPQLKRVTARTDAAEIRHIVVKRQTPCQRLLEHLLER